MVLPGVISTSSLKKEYAANTFVFIGDEMPWEEEEIENLLTAVDAGMNGFISLNEFPGSMLEKLELRMQEDNESAFVRLSIEEGIVSILNLHSQASSTLIL